MKISTLLVGEGISWNCAMSQFNWKENHMQQNLMKKWEKV